MGTNNFLPFCPTSTGTNLLSQGEYAADAERTIGNQPGVARSKLVNKALRQSSYVVGQLAQYMTDKIGADVLDDNTPARLLAQLNAAFLPLAPVVTRYLSGSGNHNLTYHFFIAEGSAEVGATYTNNAITYTVVETVVDGLMIKMTGAGAPEVSGTLTKASGTGDTTLTFYAMRAPLYMNLQMVGGGGGGGGTGSSTAPSGGSGGATTFSDGTTTFSANGGSGGSGGTTGGAGAEGGGVPTNGDVNLNGSAGCPGVNAPSGTNAAGGSGGSSYFGGAGVGGYAGLPYSGAGSAQANTGGGGGGASGPGTSFGAGGGSSGSYLQKLITDLTGTFTYAVGAAGAAGVGTGGSAASGGAGGSGIIILLEVYQ